MIRQPMVWEQKEYNHSPKSNDWYWGVVIVVICLSVLCFIFGNILLGLILIVGFFALLVLHTKEPRSIRFEINNNGILVGQEFFPFTSFKSFCVLDRSHENGHSKLLIESKKVFSPLLSIPITGLNPQIVRDFMLDHVVEQEREESFTEKFFDLFGF